MKSRKFYILLVGALVKFSFKLFDVTYRHSLPMPNHLYSTNFISRC